MCWEFVNAEKPPARETLAVATRLQIVCSWWREEIYNFSCLNDFDAVLDIFGDRIAIAGSDDFVVSGKPDSILSR